MHLNKVQTSDLHTPRASAPPRPSPKLGGRAITRLAGFGVVIFIAWTLLSMVMPAVFSHSSQRAVVDLPATLVTTPIEGVVVSQRLQIGDRFRAGDALVAIQNQNVDRSTLVELTSKKVELVQQYNAVSTQLEATRVRLADTNQKLTKYQAATQKMHDAEVAATRSRLAIANTQIEEQQDVVNRNSTLAAAGAISGSVSDTSKYQLAALQNAKAAVQAEMQAAVTGSQASRNNVFFGEKDGGVSTLAHEREDLSNTVDQLTAQASALKQSESTIDQLMAKEHDRVDRMSNFEIKAYSDGVVKDVLAPPGTQVSAGSTLIRAVNCSRAQVVAVFPRSLSDSLLPGTRLQVHVDGMDHPVGASVTGLLPRASEGDQARYFVPFPTIESNEIYALASFDKPLDAHVHGNTVQDGSVEGGDAAVASKQGDASCQLGQWVQVSIDRSWTNQLEKVVGNHFPELPFGLGRS
jgi:multidrug resistance efflux pump